MRGSPQPGWAAASSSIPGSADLRYRPRRHHHVDTTWAHRVIDLQGGRQAHVRMRAGMVVDKSFEQAGHEGRAATADLQLDVMAACWPHLPHDSEGALRGIRRIVDDSLQPVSERETPLQ